MQSASEDPFFIFLDRIENGELLKAIQLIIAHPAVSYDQLLSKEEAFRYIIHYVDACVYKGLLDVSTTNQVLQMILQSDKRLSVLADHFLTVLGKEQVLLEYLLTQISEQKPVKEVIEDIPLLYQPLVDDQLKLFQLGEDLKQAKPAWGELILGKESFINQPWHLFAYPSAAFYLIDEKQGEIPVLFLEPIEQLDYAALLIPFLHKPLFLILENRANLFQLLQFPFVFQILSAPETIIYFLDQYPYDQLKTQNLPQIQAWIKNKELRPIRVTQQPILESFLPIWLQAFKRYLTEPIEERKEETPIANWLYQLSKKVIFNIQAERYGESRCMALSIYTGYEKWFDRHKGNPPPQSDLGPISKDYFLQKLEPLMAKREVRPFAPQSKIRLAHIVPQVVDGGHAPTRLLNNLLTYGDQDWFELFLISTERMSPRFLEYPLIFYSSDPSDKRGKATLDYLSKLNVKILMVPHPQTYAQTAYFVKDVLNQLQIDIAVFHGPDEINTLCSNITDVPIRVLFEHGTVPQYSGFDLAILSTEEAFKKHREVLREKGTESCALDFCLDIRSSWEKDPYSKESLGLPSDSFVMTTISNHLDDRLSVEMCYAIIEILKNCPQAVYAPIGIIYHPERIQALFAEYAVDDRLIFLGSKMNPSQYARSMELYLNEFPFGSCLGMLDAMAAGCPVVSMYDEYGPPQAQYGASYFGRDRVIMTGKTEDYVALASQLIQNPTLYEEWSEYAKNRYEERIDVKAYVNKFEKVLEAFIDYKKK